MRSANMFLFIPFQSILSKKFFMTAFNYERVKKNLSASCIVCITFVSELCLKCQAALLRLTLWSHRPGSSGMLTTLKQQII